jgi:hypothetical protein
MLKTKIVLFLPTNPVLALEAPARLIFGNGLDHWSIHVLRFLGSLERKKNGEIGAKIWDSVEIHGPQKGSGSIYG